MNTTVKCADKVWSALLRNWSSTLAKVIILNLICMSAGSVFSTEWPPAVGIFATIAFVVAPRLIQEHRIIARTSCPACNQPAVAILQRILVYISLVSIAAEIHLQTAESGYVAESHTKLLGESEFQNAEQSGVVNSAAPLASP